MKLLGTTLAACLLAAGCSGTAGATAQEDQEFLDALVVAEVLDAGAADDVRDDAVERGREWCEKLLDPGTTREDVARSLADLLRESESAAESQRATVFFGTAAQTYCPEAAERLE